MIQHLACIMDGNRRWARSRNRLPWEGHQEGVKTVGTVIDFCLKNSISYLTLYLFSIENFKRSQEEQQYLFTIIARQAEKRVSEYNARGVKIKFIGDRSLFPQSVRDMCDRIEQQTAYNTQLHLDLLFCYGGRQEIVAGVKSCLDALTSGELVRNDLNEQTFSHYLWNYNTPDPEIVIRTGGCKRLSNFLLYQSAYSELFFLETLWPDLSTQQLDEILEEFKNRQRNFGK